MCVYHLYRCKKFYIVQGGNSPSSYVAQRSYGRCGGWVSWTHETCTCNIYIYIYIYNKYIYYIYIYYIYIIRPWAHLSRSWGDVYLIAVVFIRSMSTVIITSLSLYIYIYCYFFILRVFFIVDVFCTSDAFSHQNSQ